jgi:tetratricopeptide (TPR) repeat protein
LYIFLKKYNDAEEYLTKALKLANILGALDYTKEIEEAFSQLYSQTGKYEQALKHYQKSIAARNKISNEENIKKQTQAEMQFEFDKKEAIANAEQDKRNAVNKEERQKQRVILFSVSGFLFLVILFSIFIYREYRQKRRANIEIKLQKQIIEEKQKSILDSIHYAGRIQQSILPTEKYIEKSLNRIKNRYK